MLRRLADLGPEGAPTTRFPWAERYTGVMAAELGQGYEIVEENPRACLETPPGRSGGSFPAPVRRLGAKSRASPALRATDAAGNRLSFASARRPKEPSPALRRGISKQAPSARTTSIDDPLDPRLNGSAYLPASLASHLPLDLVVIMLGTNDTRSVYRRTPYEIALGMRKLVVQVPMSGGGLGTVYPAPKVLVVSPPPLAEMPDPGFRACSKADARRRRRRPRITRLWRTS